MHSTNDLQFASELRTVLVRLIKKLRKESVTSQQLSLTERSTLSMLLQQGSMLPSELASAEKITNQSMSQVLKHLNDLGYINREGSTTDKRKVLISLTEAGENVIKQVRSERDEWLAEAINSVCTKEEIEILKKAVLPLTKLVDHE